MGNSFLLIVVGLLLFYLVVSDKWKCVELFAACVTGKQTTAPSASPNVSLPTTPNITTAPNVTIPTLSFNSNFMHSGLYGS